MSFELQFSIVNIKAISFYCEHGYVRLKYTANRLIEHFVYIMENDLTFQTECMNVKYDMILMLIKNYQNNRIGS